MPLHNRFEIELRPDWKSHAIHYKELQREAENLVGQENEELELVFRSHLTYALEGVNEFYVEKREQAISTYTSCAHAIDTIAQVHHDREKRFLPVPNAQGKDLWKETVSPTNSTDQMWPGRTSEELEIMSSAFRVWALAAQERRHHTVHLFDFVNPAFMARLEEGALRAALQDWLKLLTFIDHLRTFALLNAVAALKLVERHCGDETRAHCRAALDALPFAHMEGMGELLQNLEGVAGSLANCLKRGPPSPSASGGASATAFPSTWSPHVCPFCTHTVSNAVFLPGSGGAGGRTCCWECVVRNSSSAIVQCPLSRRPVDLREMRVEQVLGTFLRRYFPTAYNAARDEIAHIGHDEAVKVQERAAVGIMSMRAQAEKKAASALAPTSHSRWHPAPALTTIADGKSASVNGGGGKGRGRGHHHHGHHHHGRRDRGLSLDGAPDDLNLESLGEAVSEVLQLLTTDKDAFDPCCQRHRLSTPEPLRARSAGGTASLDERRDRSVSLPCPPPNLRELLGGPPTPPGGGGGGMLRARGGRAGLARASGSCKDLASLVGDD